MSQRCHYWRSPRFFEGADEQGPDDWMHDGSEDIIRVLRRQVPMSQANHLA
jgi:hypothetical protein